MTLYLSRLRLSHDPSAQALAPLLVPEDAGLRRSATHNLLWSVFSDGADRTRDFLWREDSTQSYLTLSARPPRQTDLFLPHEVKPFAPDLSPGDLLDFSLRANATRMKRGGARVDVVMDALRQIPRGGRGAERMGIAGREGSAWLARVGETAGFALVSAEAADYSVEVLPGHRGPRRGQPQFGILDLVGRIEVRDPALFVERLSRGFGRAKAFGCGLMLIRRAA